MEVHRGVITSISPKDQLYINDEHCQRSHGFNYKHIYRAGGRKLKDLKEFSPRGLKIGVTVSFYLPVIDIGRDRNLVYPAHYPDQCIVTPEGRTFIAELEKKVCSIDELVRELHFGNRREHIGMGEFAPVLKEIEKLPYKEKSLFEQMRRYV